jgi:hypothetical protein
MIASAVETNPDERFCIGVCTQESNAASNSSPSHFAEQEICRTRNYLDIVDFRTLLFERVLGTSYVYLKQCVMFWDFLCTFQSVHGLRI